jgi:hypothetical protein
MGEKFFAWSWGVGARLFNTTRYGGFGFRAYGLRVGRRFVGVVLARRVDDRVVCGTCGMREGEPHAEPECHGFAERAVVRRYDPNVYEVEA